MKEWYNIRVDRKTKQLVKPERPEIDPNQPHWYRKAVKDTVYEDHWEYRRLAPKHFNKHHIKAGWRFYK